jgi:hypothetical protein
MQAVTADMIFLVDRPIWYLSFHHTPPNRTRHQHCGTLAGLASGMKLSPLYVLLLATWIETEIITGLGRQ